jgi:hypothetical protein
MRLVISSLILLLSLTSCIKEELPKPVVINNDAIYSVSLGKDYPNQVFFDLENPDNKISISKFDWDLWFTKEGLVRINTGRTSKGKIVLQSEINNMDIDTVSLWFDKYNTDKLSSFFPNTTDTQTFIYYPGLNKDFEKDKRKIYRSIPVESNKIYFEVYKNKIWKKLSEEPITLGQEVFISLKNGLSQTLNLTEMDLFFGGYMTYFEEAKLEYLVHGVLRQNPDLSFTKIEKGAFKQLEQADVENLDFSKKIDFIGHDWKSFNLESGKYTVNQDWIFIIKTKNEFYYTLRFMDFYNDEGEKGYPSFQIKIL